MTPLQLASSFHARFRGLERAYGTYVVKSREGNKMKGQATTLDGAVTDALWKDHLSGVKGLGITPINDESRCWWGAIDIDVYEGLSLDQLNVLIADAKLPLVTCSTKSGGAHLFVFLRDEPAPAELVQRRLSQWAYVLGHGGAEFFPKQTRLVEDNSKGSWLNMPYFDCTKKQSVRACRRDGQFLSPADFLSYAADCAVTISELETTESVTGKQDDLTSLLDGAPPCVVYLVRCGVPVGGRNNAMYQFAVYARRRWAKDDWARYAMQLAVRSGIGLKAFEINTILRSIGKKDYAYKCNDAPMKGVCDASQCNTCAYGVKSTGPGISVPITQLRKFLTRPPSYTVDVDEKRVDLTSSEDLIDSAKFRKACLEQTDVLLPRVKTDTWDQLVQALLANIETIAVPGDADSLGHLSDLVASFCTDSPRGTEFGDLLNGAVYRGPDAWYFRSKDLRTYLRSHGFVLSRNDPPLWQKLKAIADPSSGERSIEGKKLHFWSLPLTTFAEHTTVPTPRVMRNEF